MYVESDEQDSQLVCMIFHEISNPPLLLVVGQTTFGNGTEKEIHTLLFPDVLPLGLGRLIDSSINQSILKHQTDYRKQNLISMNRKTYEYVNKALRLQNIAPKRVKSILRHHSAWWVGCWLCPC